MKIRDIAYDTKASLEGVWITYPGTDIEVLTGRMFNPQMVEWVDKARREYADPITGNIPDDAIAEVTFEATVRFVCKDWRNVQDDDGKDLDFNIEVARSLFKDKETEYGHFFTWWLQESQERERFLLKTIEAQAKKSGASSSGRENGADTSTSSEPGTPKTKTHGSSHHSHGSKEPSK